MSWPRSFDNSVLEVLRPRRPDISPGMPWNEAEQHREQLPGGWIHVWRRKDGVWGVSWSAFSGDRDYPGRTYTSTNPVRPDDFPTEYDLEALLDWARRRWGGPRS